MYVLVRLKVGQGTRARCVVEHLRPDEDGTPRLLETIEEQVVPPRDLPHLRDRGWIVPANPQPGDTLRFELADIEPFGSRGADLVWEASMSEANGPSRMPDPLMFRAEVTGQGEVDLTAAEDATVTEGRAEQDGPRSFRWTAPLDEKAAA